MDCWCCKGIEMAVSETSNSQSEMERHWLYRPDVPVQTSPIFAWPPEPKRAFRWVVGSWLGIAENLILAFLAWACWTWFSPSLAEAKVLQIGWITEILVRNLVLMIAVAGGLHLYFHV